jgi:tetratricopeptide (TPR) repeat protein
VQWSARSPAADQQPAKARPRLACQRNEPERTGPSQEGTVFLSEELTPHLAAAAGVYGEAVLDPDQEPSLDPRATLGRRLLQQIFGVRDGDGPLPGAVQALIMDPADPEARDALEGHVQGALTDDPVLAAAVAETLTRFYRHEIDAGNIQAMTDLGDLLRGQGDFDGSRAAYQQAVDRGNAHALIDLGDLLCQCLGDTAGARAAYQQAAGSGDPDMAPEALAALGHLLMTFQRDYAAAGAYFRQAISSAHPQWSPGAMVGLALALALALARQGDTTGARDAYQQAVESGDDDTAARASVFLGTLLHKHGDVAGARNAYLRVVDSRNADWAPPALTELLNLLRDQDDLEGIRAARRRAVDTANPDAPYALVVMGQLLEARGDTEAAQAAFQQAAEAGYPDR